VVDFCDLDDNDGLTCYYVYSCFETYHITINFYHTTINFLWEILKLDVVLKDETTQTYESRIIDKTSSFTRHRRKYK
jgi:hypothetical protein